MIPLSTRLRPRKLDEFIGQEHFLYSGSLLYNSIKNRSFDSAIFFGPSGTGKTTLARIIANEMDSNFIEINASTTGTKELKELIENAKDRLYGLEKKSTYVYIDEFHRWNKLQQDSLLKALEDGVIKFIGSTTENPYFAINNAVISRVRNIYEFNRLTKDDLLIILKRAVDDEEIGFGKLNLKINENAMDLLAEMSNGDARVALDALGFIIDNMSEGKSIDKDLVEEAMQRKIGFYDKDSDRYNLLSALQKSIRGSDPDASIHYFARLIDGGADIRMIGRRLLVIAAEDVGMAYPTALTITNSAVSASLIVGLPEATIILSEAVILLASSPKSNRSYMAYKEAAEDIKNRKIDDVPSHLMDNHYSGSKKLGKGIGYKYPHSTGGYVKQQYLPDNLYKEKIVYYKPTDNGAEKSFKIYLENLKGKDK
ncbi:MAG: replication-associated recombination protein A [Peptostreptococcaceae bacterium]|nr:replication-associated recombination protein A [Peptostreptococcaceae bacterium]